MHHFNYLLGFINQGMLSFIRLKNYKNLELSDRLNLHNLNVWIGANGSGKSNLLSCLEFLKDSLTAIPDENRGVTAFENALAKIGRSRILDSRVASPAKIDFAYGFSQLSSSEFSQESGIFELKLYADKSRGIVNIAEEYLYAGEDLSEVRETPPFYYYQLHNREAGKGAISVYKEDIRTTKFEFLENIPTNSLGLSSIPALLENSQFSPEKTSVYKIRRNLISFISNWQFYNANNMNLNKIKMSEPKIGGSDIYLSPTGENLPLVLENLSQKNLDFEDSINEAMKSILPQTRRVRSIRSGRLSLTVEWYFEGINEPFYLSEMSDGTVRMLCWAIILHSPFLPSLLVIDEPELGLHVAWMGILAEWIKQAARKTQVIITTHSPDLLDRFTDCLENVFCFSSANKTHFTIKTLSKELLETQLNEGWELGDLYRVGDPNVGGWPW